MILWDFLNTCLCDQMLYLYLMNDYGEYRPVYRGVKTDIPFWEGDYDDDVFSLLQNDIEVFKVLPDAGLQVEIKDTPYDRPMREQYSKDAQIYWVSHPENTPWGYYTDTEAYCQIAGKVSRWAKKKE